MVAKSRHLSLLEGASAGILFGTAAIFIRLVDVNVLSITLWRLIIAASVLAVIIMILKGRHVTNVKRESLRHFLVLGMLLGAHFMLFVSAVKNTTILNATVLVNTTPIFSVIISTLFYRARPSRLALTGILCSFVGAGVIALGYTGKMENVNPIGDLEAVLAAVTEGFYLNYGGKRRRQLPLLPAMLFIYLGAALTVGSAMAVTETSFEVVSHTEKLLPLIGLGILPTALAHTLYFSSLSNLKSFETAAMALLEPLGATFLGIMIFAEIPAQIFVFGASLVLAGIVAVALE
ncbi:MAG: DMT family transporter [Candidatus Bathyarchaeota archaeon]|nr:MAG: DMT family transporter [Candidatus Bathyarchaeota archaeon]